MTSLVPISSRPVDVIRASPRRPTLDYLFRLGCSGSVAGFGRSGGRLVWSYRLPPPLESSLERFAPLTGASIDEATAASADQADDATSDVPPVRYRTIFISDIHLGTAGCKAEYLLDFLRHHESDWLYLIGDIVDGWALRSRFYWHQTHNDVLQKLLRRARKGTRVVYVPGNHDEAARPYCGLNFGDIAIVEDAVHTLADGRRLWVVHGDLADGVIRHAKWLAHLGDTLYELLLWINRHFNSLRARLGFGYWSLSQYLKHKVKNAVSFISDFENVLIREARRRGYDGVVCGHIHQAEIRQVDGMLYCNDGDWVESLTAIVETYEGELRIVTWNTIRAPGKKVLRWNEGDADEVEPGRAEPPAREQPVPLPTPVPAKSRAPGIAGAVAWERE